MESINSAVNAATKAVWGSDETKREEPLSGVTGDTSKGEPYDAGNIEDPDKPTSKPTPDGAPTNPKQVGPDTTAGQSDVAHPESKPDAEKPDAERLQDPPRAAEKPTPAEEDAAAKIDGPGPRPLADVAREHGGDAGNLGAETGSGGGGGPGGELGAPPVPPKDGAPASSSSSSSSEEKEGQSAAGKVQDKGTGEQYVQSSGVVADGGDFDASAPGAGREADRLLEEKGIHKEADSTPSTKLAGNDSSTSSPAAKDKKSLGQRIKDKLHHN